MCAGKGLVEVINNLNIKNNLVGLEIGCSLGYTTVHFLSNFSDLKLYGIDPYIEYTDWNGNFLSLDHHNENYEIFKQNIIPYKNRHFLYKNTSDGVVNEFDDNSLDFIFIDGLHTYEQVLKDCINYYPKVKSGGLFSGHDFNVIPAVNKAVIEFANQAHISQIYNTEIDVWYWIKP